MQRSVIIIAMVAMSIVLGSCVHQAPEQPISETGTKPGYGQADFFKPMRGDYWAVRYSYPTNRFEPAWLAESRLRHNAHERRRPEGINLSREHLLKVGGSGLSPTSFTELGPLPLQGGSARYSGRINVVVLTPDRSDHRLLWC